jgi:hypothetical protein
MASTYQYWRLNFNGVTNGSSLVAIAEVQFLDSSTPSPISLSGGTASASTSFSGSFVAANAFDGNPATAWASSANPSSGSPQWLQYQFTGAVSVTSVALTVRNDSGAWTSQSPTAVQIQGSPDGTTWTTILSYIGIVWTINGQTQTFFASTAVGSSRVSQVAIEAATQGSNARVSQIATEAIGGSNPNARLSQLAVEILGGSKPNVRLSQLVVEIIYPYIQPVPVMIQNFILP